MSNNNHVQLIGNLGSDPETRYTPGGTAVAKLSVATTDKWRDRSTGEQKESTEWHIVQAWGALAERAGQLRKGAAVIVIGSIATEKWQDKDGVDRYTTKIQASRIIPTNNLPAQPGYTGDSRR